jgi:hypothetical protein
MACAAVCAGGARRARGRARHAGFQLARECAGAEYPWDFTRFSPMRGSQRRLCERVAKICLAQPGARREDHNSHSQFSVGKKVFAYILDNHHGDGIVALCFRTAPGEQEVWLEIAPERYFRPAYIGARGWTALRLDRGRVSFVEIEKRVGESWLRTAPRKLAAGLARQ